MKMESSRRYSGSSEGEMSSSALETQRAFPEEETLKLVLKGEQGLMKPEEGSLAAEMGSDVGWAVTKRACNRSGWEEMKDWPSVQILTQVLRTDLEMASIRSLH